MAPVPSNAASPVQASKQSVSTAFIESTPAFVSAQSPAKPVVTEYTAAIADAPLRPAPSIVPSAVARVAEEGASGLASAQVDAIKSALQNQKFLWSMIEHVTRWEMESGELRLFFPSERSALAEMLQARDPMERLRTVLNQVVGQPLRVCVKLDSSRAPVANRNSELRARFEEDPIVRAMLQKFGGQISGVKRPGEA